MTAPTAPPPSARRWLAGLLELAGDLVQQAGLLVHHVGDGIETLARVVDPGPPNRRDNNDDGGGGDAEWVVIVDGDHQHAVPRSDAIKHDLSDDCPCGPAMRCQQTGRGDVWLIKHHRLTPDTPTTPEGA